MLTDHNEEINDTEHATVQEERLYTAEEAEIHDKELCALKILQEYKNGTCPPRGPIWSHLLPALQMSIEHRDGSTKAPP